MRLAFADFIPWDYRVDSVYQMPLGGAQSAVCYLTEALAQQGEEVFLLTFTSAPGTCRGVECLSLWQSFPQSWFHSLDALIVVLAAGQGRAIRAQLGRDTRLVLWTGHAHDQPAIRMLHDPLERDAFDRIVVVSDWQCRQFHACFGIDPARMCVLRNAIGPSFHNLFPGGTPIVAQKTRPPVLAYTSTPFRGLDVLLDIFPRIRSAVAGTTLKVFSSMQVYQVAKTEDEAQFGQLYRKCRETEGVEHVGSLPQPELAGELRSVSVFAYPNTFAETGCIVAMEAMASGCWVVTSDLGALPETTAGFGQLIPIVWEDPEHYKGRFVEETVNVLRKLTDPDTSGAEAHLRRQVDYVNSSVTWSERAKQWTQLLKEMG